MKRTPGSMNIHLLRTVMTTEAILIHILSSTSPADTEMMTVESYQQNALVTELSAATQRRGIIILEVMLVVTLAAMTVE